MGYGLGVTWIQQDPEMPYQDNIKELRSSALNLSGIKQAHRAVLVGKGFERQQSETFQGFLGPSFRQRFKPHDSPL